MSSDEQLWIAALQGQRPAFAEIVRRHQGPVCAVTFSVTGDRALSEDLAQDTFVAAWQARADLRDGQKLGAWHRGIARNLARNVRKKAYRRREVAGDDVDARPHTVDTEDVLEARDASALVWRALERVPESYREALVLFYREERSTKEVASQLGLSVAAVEQRLSRGRNHLRGEVEALVERTLHASRPDADLSKRVLAALPPAAALPTMEPATPAPPATATASSLVPKAAAIFVATSAAAWLATANDSQRSSSPSEDSAIAALASPTPPTARPTEASRSPKRYEDDSAASPASTARVGHEGSAQAVRLPPKSPPSPLGTSTPANADNRPSDADAQLSRKAQYAHVAMQSATELLSDCWAQHIGETPRKGSLTTKVSLVMAPGQDLFFDRVEFIDNDGDLQHEELRECVHESLLSVQIAPADHELPPVDAEQRFEFTVPYAFAAPETLPAVKAELARRRAANRGRRFIPVDGSPPVPADPH